MNMEGCYSLHEINYVPVVYTFTKLLVETLANVALLLLAWSASHALNLSTFLADQPNTRHTYTNHRITNPITINVC